jgi:hypothetical protein
MEAGAQAQTAAILGPPDAPLILGADGRPLNAVEVDGRAVKIAELFATGLIDLLDGEIRAYAKRQAVTPKQVKLEVRLGDEKGERLYISLSHVDGDVPVVDTPKRLLCLSLKMSVVLHGKQSVKNRG